ncbi:MAG: hypothetical protein GY850_26245 [bacterium]|nr:hypothetical protein [bacterium]
MKTLKTVGVEALKNHLASYLHDVQSGAFILISDKGKVIAELRKPSVKTGRPEEISLKDEWIKQGKLTMPKTAKKRCHASPVCLKPGTASLLLDEERG